MAVQKKKSSKSRTRRKHAANYVLQAPSLVQSKESGAYVLRHRVDLKSGFYRGKQIFEPEELEKLN